MIAAQNTDLCLKESVMIVIIVHFRDILGQIYRLITEYVLLTALYMGMFDLTLFSSSVSFSLLESVR